MARRKPPENHDPLLRAVGERIKTLREASKKAQEIFAYEAGIDRSYYGRLERGSSSPTVVSLAKIAVALNVEVGELFPDRQTIKELLSRGTDGTGNAGEPP